MEGEMDAMQVCENGHKITEFYHWAPNERKSFCGQCTVKTPTIYQCPSCQKEIPGNSHSEHSAGAATIENVRVPNSCEFCGEPFPWTVKKNQPDYHQMAYDLREREEESKRKQQLQVLEALVRTTIDPTSISSALQLARLEEERTSLFAALVPEPISNIQPVHNTINNFHDSQVIQNSPGAVQTVNVNNQGSMELINQLLPLLSEFATTANLNAALAADLNSHIKTIQGQMEVSKPNQTILNEGLKEVWGLIKGVATEIIAAKFKLLLGLTN